MIVKSIKLKIYLEQSVLINVKTSNKQKLKQMLNKLFLLMMVVATATITSCTKDEEVIIPTELNIYETAKTNSELSSLVAAIEKAGLTDELSSASATLTVFAPTNAAFSAFLSANGFASLNDVPNDVLTSVLLNHVVNGKNVSTGLTTGYVKTLATFGATTSNLSLYVSTASGVTLNGISKVTTADVNASNGVIHIVDQVIGLPTVVTFAVSNPDFSSLVAALTRPDLTTDYVTILSGAGPFTVFAPNNAAFSSLLTELGVASLNDIDVATLEKVLNYHVVSGNVLAEDLTNGQIVPTLNGDSFTIGLTGGATITDINSRISNIIATDVQSSNGVIHVIDKVILPTL
ncbi:MAG: fasciclin domain-containing protein [Chitinophagales bacterium]|nr:fasciclin domain-containing protein [Chitinophagales bacterium]